MGCFASGLLERGIFPVFCTLYFCVNEVSFKSFALEMDCLIVQDFKNEAYILYTELRIFVLSAFFFLRLEKRYLKYSASEERGIFQVIRV